MNQKSQVINLRQFTLDDHPFGNVQGKDVFRKLTDYIDSNPAVNIFGVSLAEIVATDASFPRESVIAIAKQYRGEKGFYLEAINGRDLIDNWNYAAKAKEQPLVIWSDNSFEVIGPEVSQSNSELINYILEKGLVTTSQISTDFNVSIPNASTRLKKLVQQGYIMRAEEVAESGGIEFIYHAIN